MFSRLRLSTDCDIVVVTVSKAIVTAAAGALMASILGMVLEMNQAVPFGLAVGLNGLAIALFLAGTAMIVDRFARRFSPGDGSALEPQVSRQRAALMASAFVAGSTLPFAGGFLGL